MAAACPNGHSNEDYAAMADCLNGYEGRRTAVLDGMVRNKGGVLFVWKSITLSGPPKGARTMAKDMSGSIET